MEAFEEEVERLAREKGISFSAALALKNGELPDAPRPAKRAAGKKEAGIRAGVEKLREGMRELQERSIRNLEMMCGQQFTWMIEDGEIEKHAKERGLLYQDAFRELQDEVYQPLIEAQLQRSGRGASSLAMAEEEREMQGFTNKEVEWRAKSRSIPYREAFDQLTEERAAKDAEGVRKREELERGRRERAERRLEGVALEEVTGFAEEHVLSVRDAYTELGQRFYEEEASK